MNKRPLSNVYKPLLDLSNRELGLLPARIFPNRLGASEDLLLRLDVFRTLEKHKGCVNTVSFNADGDILVSGSDDRRIILWDWQSGQTKLSFHSGHSNNVFQAKIMPHSDDRSIVTCAADGQVRHAQILGQGGAETKLLGKHQARAHRLAIEPGSPHIFYTCGEDGLVQHFDLRTGVATELFTCQPINDRWNYMPVIHLNTIAIDPRNPNLFVVGGSDEYTRLYDIRKYKWDGSSDFGQPTNFFCPPHLVNDERVGITGLAFSTQRELLVSYNDEFIYLFTQDMGLGPNFDPKSPPISTDSDTSETEGSHESGKSPSNTGAVDNITPLAFKGHRNCETVKGVNFLGPNCEYVVSGSDCGRIFIWKKKGRQLVRVMEADKHVVNCIESHPHTMVLASSGIEHNIKIWTPKALEKATLPKIIEQVVMGRIDWFDTTTDDDDDDDDDSDNVNPDDFDEDFEFDDLFEDYDQFDDLFDNEDDNEDEDVDVDDENDSADEDDCEDDNHINECSNGENENDRNDDDNNGVGDDNNDDNGNNNDNFAGGL